MQIQMHFEKEVSQPLKRAFQPTDHVAVILRGTPVLVEILRKHIVDFMEKQEGFQKHY